MKDGRSEAVGIMRKFINWLYGVLKRYTAIAALIALLLVWFGVDAGLYKNYAIIIVYFITGILPAWIWSAYDWKKNTVRKYDSGIIGSCFGGIDRASLKFRKGMRFLFSGSFNASLNCFQETAEFRLTERETAVLDFYTGMCYRNMGYPTNSAQYFVKSIAEGINHPDAYLNAARGYSRAECINEAKELYDKLFELDYHKIYYDFLYTDMGMMYVRTQHPDEAIGYFNQGIEAGMDVQSAYGGLALAYLLKKDAEKSCEYYRKAVLSNLPDRESFIAYFRDSADACGMHDLPVLSEETAKTEA